MILIFPYGNDDAFAQRCNAAVTIAAHAARLVPSRPLPAGLRGPFEQLSLVWESLPEDLVSAFTRAYGAWTRERERQVHSIPGLEEAAIDACRYAAALVSLVHVQLEVERRRLVREQQELVEE
ncbi:MAG: hypothetical protein Q7R80_04715, partial [bacterium]|nr:hypothetical protein [bacterium]